MAKKIAATDRHIRIAELVRLISCGAPTSQLVQFCADNWGIGRRQSEKYIAEARAAIIADVDVDRKEIVAELLHGARTVWTSALKEKQYNNALGAMNLIVRLGGLEPK